LELVDRSDNANPKRYASWTQPVFWLPQDQAAAAPSGFKANGYQINDTGYYNCYSYNYFTYLIQEALNSAFISLSAILSDPSNPIANPASVPPILIWDSTTNCAKLVCETAGYVQGAGGAVGLVAPDTWVQGSRGLDKMTGATQTLVSAASSDTFNTQLGNTKGAYLSDAMEVPTFTTQATMPARSLIQANALGWNRFWNGVANTAKTIVKKVVNGGKTVLKSVGDALKTVGNTVKTVSGNSGNPVAVVAGSALGGGLLGFGAGISSINNRILPVSENPFNNLQNSGGSGNPVPGYNITGSPIVQNSPSWLNYTGSNAVIEISFNAALYQLFNSFPAFANGFSTELAKFGKNYRIIVANTSGVNETTYSPTYPIASAATAAPFKATVVTQEYPTIFNMSPITSLVFCSNTLPIQPNMVSTPVIYNNGQQIQMPGMNAAIANIITDLTVDSGNYRPYLVYIPQAQYRLITMNSNRPLYNLDLSVFYRTKFGDLIPFKLASGASITIKLAFLKKTAAKLLDKGLLL
jgi:hypothetical protein